MKLESIHENLLAGGTTPAEAQQVCEWLARSDAEPLTDQQASRQWSHLSQQILSPRHDFALHLALYRRCYRLANTFDQPAWLPDQATIETSQIGGTIKQLGLDGYEALYRWSIEQRESFWTHTIEKLGIRFDTRFVNVVDTCASASPTWLVGGRMNIVESCFADHSESDVAIISSSPAADDGDLEKMTYGELRSLVARVANGLIEGGVKSGESVGIVMPMTPRAVSIYLGIIAAGCVAVSVADSFSPEEIAVRFRIANVRRVFTQDFARWGSKQVPLYRKVKTAVSLPAIVVTTDQLSLGSLHAGDASFADLLSRDVRLRCVTRDPQDMIQILFSSGTTAEPKAIPWDHTTPIKCAADGYYHHNLQTRDITCWPTNLGWMMGPWLIFASLINRCAMALYPQAPTDAGFGQFVQDAKVTMLGLVPSLVRTWRQRNCLRGFDWTSVKAFSSTGECSNPEDMFYLMHLAKYRPVIEYCGGTEIGGGYVTGTVVQPCIVSAFSTPALGIDFHLVDDDGKPSDQGEVMIDGASIGLSRQLLERDHWEVYFDGNRMGKWGLPLRRHGDELCRLNNGYYRVVGRSDDTMNLGGIKVGCAEIERVINRLPGIVESAAVAASSAEGGPSRLIVFLVLQPGYHESPDSFQPTIQQAIREQLNPLFHVSEVRLVDSMPRTESNKIMRRKLRAFVP